MIVLRQLAFARAAKLLVEAATLQIGPGWKLALTGANGSGKSSFFALFTGLLHAERGDLDWPSSWQIAHVAQDTPALPDPAIEFVLDGDAELRRIEAELAAAETAHDGVAIGHLHARLDEIGGYAARARAAELLHGLGFSEADQGRPVAEFSGGWRVRLNLARALMCRSDLLLLDEPTNHLDLDAVFWLESWLKAYRGTLLMISHDRDFIDAIADHILHIEQAAMKLYSGNYSAFERQRAAALALQQSLYERQQREAAHLQRFIDRFRAKATKARQAQSRIKALERMGSIAAAHIDTPFTFRFREQPSAPDPLLSLESASAGYAGQPILSELMLTLRPGERIALLGRNGAGKSTLVQLLAGEMAPLTGKRLEGKGLRIGYFAQHQLEQLRLEESPLQHLVRQDGQTREQELRDYLGGFDFRGDMVTQSCGRFSGGEKSRLALALLIWQRPNLLLLDEPTNHLDLEMREALNLALQEYEGGVVLVSHDRHLLSSTADRLLLVAAGAVRPFDGDLDDYASWLAGQSTPQCAVTEARAEQKQSRKDARTQAAAERQTLLAQRRPLIREIEQLERQMSAWQSTLAEIETSLTDSALYSAEQRERLLTLTRQQGELRSQLDAAEGRWLVAQETLDALPAPD